MVLQDTCFHENQCPIQSGKISRLDKLIFMLIAQSAPVPLTYDKADSTKKKKKQRLMNQLLMTRSWSYILQLLHEFIFLVDNRLSLRYHQQNCGLEVLEQQLLLANLTSLQIQQDLRYAPHVCIPLNKF